MVFQKPNPFPAMTISDNVLSGLNSPRTPVGDKDDLVEEMLTKASLWNEVKDRLGELGGASVRVASNRGSASRVPWRSDRGSCSWTSRARHSTRPRHAGSKRRSPTSPTRSRS